MALTRFGLRLTAFRFPGRGWVAPGSAQLAKKKDLELCQRQRFDLDPLPQSSLNADGWPPHIAAWHRDTRGKEDYCRLADNCELILVRHSKRLVTNRVCEYAPLNLALSRAVEVRC